MCGIYGTTTLYTSEVFERKLSSMKFRGPDYQGLNSYGLPNGGTLSLGHVRLSVVDLDRRSNQPFQYSDNSTNGSFDSISSNSFEYIDSFHLLD